MIAAGEDKNIIDFGGFQKKKMPTKRELLTQTIDKNQEINDKFGKIQAIFNNLQKRITDDEDKFTNDILQSIILILALKEVITQELKIDDTKWNAVVEKVTKKLALERERDFDEKHGLITVDRAIVVNDYVVASFDGTLDGKPFAGGHSDGAVIHIGSKMFLEDFENSLIGKSKGETFDTLIKFPDNYTIKTLAGKTANFCITIMSVKEKKVNESGGDKNEPTTTA